MSLMKSPVRKVLKQDTHYAIMWTGLLRAFFGIGSHTIIRNITLMRYILWPYICAYIYSVLFCILLIYSFFQQFNIIIKITYFPWVSLSSCYMIWIYRIAVLDLRVAHIINSHTLYLFFILSLKTHTFSFLSTLKKPILER